jgi:hypothetical protein
VGQTDTIWEIYLYRNFSKLLIPAELKPCSIDWFPVNLAVVKAAKRGSQALDSSSLILHKKHTRTLSWFTPSIAIPIKCKPELTTVDISYVPLMLSFLHSANCTYLTNMYMSRALWGNFSALHMLSNLHVVPSVLEAIRTDPWRKQTRDHVSCTVSRTCLYFVYALRIYGRLI